MRNFPQNDPVGKTPKEKGHKLLRPTCVFLFGRGSFLFMGTIRVGIGGIMDSTDSTFMLPAACVLAFAVFAGPIPPELTADTLMT